MSDALGARSLFAAARDDGPDDDERDAMFRRIAISTSAAVASAAAGAHATTAGATKAAVGSGVAGSGVAGSGAAGVKLLAVGGLIGAAAMGLGIVLASSLLDGPAPRTDVAPRQRGGAVAPAPGARLGEPAPRRLDPRAPGERAAAAAGSVTTSSAPAPANAPRPDGALAAPSSASALAEEARLVTEARRALVGGDAARALTLVRAAKKLRARAMEPEELGLEARALHALGRADEAAVIELELRRRFPDHALAR